MKREIERPMRALCRVVRDGIGLLALLVVAAIAVMWVSSYWYHISLKTDSVTYHVVKRPPSRPGGGVVRRRQHAAWIVGGHLVIDYQDRRFIHDLTERAAYESRYPEGRTFTFEGRRRSTSFAQAKLALTPPPSAERVGLGFWLSRVHRPDWRMAVPCWPILLLAGVPSALWLLRLRNWRRRRGRQAAGLCPACGYDLRASPPAGPCPECGAGAPAAGAMRAPPAERPGTVPMTQPQ